MLPRKNAFVVNLFNLSDEKRVIRGSVNLRELGLDPAANYRGSEPWGSSAGGEFRVELEMPPWSARVAQFQAAATR
ncbi:MAG: hypothetical protein AB1486_27100 [Planctomycetota bacterium]